jgi:redox-sensitive bicupin YhaK (pirin superfamily)
MSIRPVRKIVEARPTLEGAGVRLHRGFGFGDTTEFDPFLLFDDFRNDNPRDFLAGFPWHPHRGIETITYVLAGTVEHGDSLGNRGQLGAGDVQWMTAGRGIMHQEMPQGDAAGRMHGFQLWANLPRSLKMTTPRYQDIGATDIPEVVDDDGTTVRIVCGEFWGRRGPVEGIAADPRYLDVFIPAATARSCSSIAATRSPFRPATRACASSWCPDSRSKSPSPGTARS